MSSLNDLGGWPGILTRLIERNDLSSSETRAVMRAVLSGDATPAQIAGFLVALRSKGETADEMTGLLDAVLDAATPVELEFGQIEKT